MQKIKILKTGEVLEVSNNEAHTLIDNGLARLITYKDRSLRVIPKIEVEDIKPKKKKKIYRSK